MISPAEWPAIERELSRTYDRETVQDLLVILFKHQPENPVHYARRCIRTVRAAQRHTNRHPVCPVEDYLPDLDPSNNPLTRAMARQAVERVPKSLLLDALGVEQLKPHTRFRQRAAARPRYYRAD